MNVSPLDLRQQKFRTIFRGLDPIEVAAFLTAVADDYEEALRETDRMRQEVARLEGLVRGYVEQEKSLQNTLMSASRTIRTALVSAPAVISSAMRWADISVFCRLFSCST